MYVASCVLEYFRILSYTPLVPISIRTVGHEYVPFGAVKMGLILTIFRLEKQHETPATFGYSTERNETSHNSQHFSLLKTD